MLRKSPLAAAVGIALATVPWITSDPVYAQAGAVDEIVVTGTRIRPDVYASSTPMDVITSESGQVRGLADLGTLLQTSTVALGSPQVTAASSTIFVQDGGPGCAHPVTARSGRQPYAGAAEQPSCRSGRRARFGVFV
jgi:outer membrane cobalamin receptor